MPMRRFRDILDSPAIYRAWQAPFARQKLAPVLEMGAGTSESLLDVGCGPGTNARAFEEVPRYLGIDLNHKYVAFAKKRYKRDFRVVDVSQGLPDGERFETVLMNSLMHHLTDDESRFLLNSVVRVLAPAGEVHVLDLVLADSGLPRKLALADRGEYPRVAHAWSDLVGEVFCIRHHCEYSLGVGPLDLWHMIHFQLSV